MFHGFHDKDDDGAIFSKSVRFRESSRPEYKSDTRFSSHILLVCVQLSCFPWMCTYFSAKYCIIIMLASLGIPSCQRNYQTDSISICLHLHKCTPLFPRKTKKYFFIFVINQIIVQCKAPTSFVFVAWKPQQRICGGTTVLCTALL